MSNRLKQLPMLIMLIAGGCTAVITFILDYDTTKALWILIGVLLLFYILGSVIQKIIYNFEEEIAEKEALLAEEEGKVVEKDGVAFDGSSEEDEGSEDTMYDKGEDTGY